MELNEKLAEWVGFKQLPKGKKGFHYERTEKIMNWMPPNRTEWWESRDYVPNFTESLDDCFEWLVPKLYELGFWMQWYLDTNGCDVRIHHLNSQDNHSIYQDKDPALALCLAISKLIEQDVDNVKE